MVSVRQKNKRRSSGNKGNKVFMPASRNSSEFANHALNAAMFSVNQMPDNPGYVDFNEPTPVMQPPIQGNQSAINNVSGNGTNRNGGSVKNNEKGRFKNIGGGISIKQKNNQSNGGNRNNNGNNINANRRKGGSNGRQRNAAPFLGNRSFRNNFIPRMSGPIVPPQMCPMPPPPPQMMLNGTRFGPRPFMPPPLAGRNGPMGGMRPMPLHGVPMLSPRNRRGMRSVLPPINVIEGGVNRRGNIQDHRNVKNRKRSSNDGSINKLRNRKSNSNKKTLKEIVNQYSLDKPWITDELRNEAKIKEDIENRLKGNKDDILFAEFKVQRDKFVNLYELTKKEYLDKKRKDNEKTLTESDKTNSKQDTISNVEQTVEAAATT